MEPELSIERRIVTVLFADIVGFTTLSERLDAEDVATIQDAYFAGVREVISRYGGRLEKFIGDAAMAVFGLPAAHDDDAERGVRAGLALVASVERLNSTLDLDASQPPLQLRVGVNTGEVVATLSGQGEWRVTGDTVNTAARLQTGARPGGVLLGETTALTVADAIELEDSGPLELKGKAEAVRAWHATSIHSERSRERAMGRLRAPMLGRQAELDLLEEALARLAPGRSERILVVAPPGTGKSRLVAEFAATASTTARVWVAPVRAEPEPSFPAIARLIGAALSSIGLGGEPTLLAMELVKRGASPVRAEVLSDEIAAALGERSSASPAGDREQRFTAWIEALDLLAGGGPSVWILEDLHWAGPDLLAFIDQAHATPSPNGRLVIGTTRPSLLERDPEWCRNSTDERIGLLDLEPLPPGSAGDLIAALVGDALPPDVVERIVIRSDGNPLFIEELLRTWLSIGTLVRDDEGYRLVDTERTVELPTTVQAIYAGQLDDLPSRARLLARRASVAGRVFPTGALPSLEAPAGGMDILRTRALISGPMAADLGPSYAYRHILLRDAGYASLARVERSRLHVRLAGWMEEAAGSRVDQVAASIAGHYEDALAELPTIATTNPALDRKQLRTTAAGWLERAARVALGSAAHAAAREMSRRALDLTPADDWLDRARRVELLGEATGFSGDMDQGSAHYREATDLYRALLQDESATTAAEARSGYGASVLALGTLEIEQLRFRDAEALANAALDAIGPADDLATARLTYLRAWAHVAYQPRPESAPDLNQAIQIAEREGDLNLLLDIQYLVEGLQQETGHITRDEIVRRSDVQAGLALEIGAPRRAATILRMASMQLSETNPTAGSAYLERSARLAEAHGLLEEQAWAHYARSEIDFVRGDWSSATDSALAALEIAEANNYFRPIVRTWMVLSVMALAQGRLDIMRRAKAWFDPRRAGFPDSPFGRFMHTAIDLRFAEAGLMDPFAPGDDLLDAWNEAPGLPSWWAATWTNVGAWIDGHDRDTAREALRRIGGWRRHPFSTPLGIAVEDALIARLRLKDGDLMAALSVAEQALRTAESIPATWTMALCERIRATALVAADRTPEAAQALSHAAFLENDLGVEAPLSA
jgi:class 3 adenylate cyclase/tetratricopeptide (TPR) repeat protein